MSSLSHVSVIANRFRPVRVRWLLNKCLLLTSDLALARQKYKNLAVVLLILTHLPPLGPRRVVGAAAMLSDLKSEIMCTGDAGSPKRIGEESGTADSKSSWDTMTQVKMSA